MKKKIITFLILFLSFLQIKAQDPNDCVNAITVCGNTNLNGLTVVGSGNQELTGTNDCSSQENNSLWLSVTIATNGTLAFTLTPQSTDINIDYDFFIYGPDVTCGSIGQAIRCSTTNPAAAGQGNNLTGLRDGINETSEGPGADGDSFVSSINATAGETYFIVIDRPPITSNSAFDIDFTGTASLEEGPSNDSGSVGGNPSPALDLISCDTVMPLDDGLTTFNLEQNTASIVGSQTRINVTYHLNLNDATIGSNNLSSPFMSTSNPQTIFARFENMDTGCFETTSFQISSEKPVGNTANLEICSNDVLNHNLEEDVNINSTFVWQATDNTNVTGETIISNTSTSITDMLINQTSVDQTVIYTVTPTSIANSCLGDPYTVEVIVHPNPVLLNSNPLLIQCDDDSDGFSAFNLFESASLLSSNHNNETFIFYDLSGRRLTTEEATAYTNRNATRETLNVDIVSNEGCISRAQVDLEVSTSKILISFERTFPICDDISNPRESFNFSSVKTEIETTGPGGIFPAGQMVTATFYENENDALAEINPISDINNYNYLTDINLDEVTIDPQGTLQQRIWIRVDGNRANDCLGLIDGIELIVNPLPQIDIEDEYVLCLLSDLTIENSITDRLPSPPIDTQLSDVDYSFQWFSGTEAEVNANPMDVIINGETEPDFSPLRGGFYTVVATNRSTGCDNIATTFVREISPPESIIVSVNDAFTGSNTVEVEVIGNSSYEYRLDNGPWQTSPIFTNVSGGEHSIFVRDIYNCHVLEEIIFVVDFPRFFTPNNDGYNDLWKITSLEALPNAIVTIFDRFGKLLAQINPGENGWDGSYNGEKLPTDDYWFVVDYIEPNDNIRRQFRAHFTLKR